MNKLDDPVFTIVYTRPSVPVESDSGGYITYGSVDTEHCHTDFDYLPITSQTAWRFPMDGFRVGSFYVNRTIDGISDSGTATIAAPPFAFQAILDATNAIFDEALNHYVADCDAPNPDIVFYVGGKEYAIPPKKYLVNFSPGQCILAVTKLAEGSIGGAFLLGAPWISAYCNIHDVGQGRIGFAKVREP